MKSCKDMWGAFPARSQRLLGISVDSVGRSCISTPLMRRTFSSAPRMDPRWGARHNQLKLLPRALQYRQISNTLKPASPTRPGSNSPPNANAPSNITALDHYAFFPQTLPRGPPPSGEFAIDVRALRREFLQLQAVAHPDRHPPADKARAEATSARINEAYKVLQNPLLRTQYLLGRRGIDVATDETATMDDQDVLMQVLDANERIEEAQREEDLHDLEGENEQRIAECERIIEQAFQRDDLEVAKREAVKLRYWVNIRESLGGWELGRPVVMAH